jgi:hypothetical protein
MASGSGARTIPTGGGGKTVKAERNGANEKGAADEDCASLAIAI